MATWLGANLLIFFCGKQMVRFVAEKAMEKRLKELNKQLNKTMIVCVSQF
jgi:hypothetical protein